MARGIDQPSTVQRHFAFLAYIDLPRSLKSDDPLHR
jgi:hypothetical protein